jgi:site-specific DNA recombinase
MTRTAIYARYSSDNQRDASIDDQVRLCRAWLEGQGHDTGKVYADRAVSGASLIRPGIQSLLEDCLSSRIDMIVAEALDRISRDQEDVAGIFKRFTFAGVKLVTLAEGEVSDLHVGLKGTMNQIFLKDLADKTRRGLRGRVEAGRSGGGLCFGYDVVPGKDDDRGKRRINETEAHIVRRIHGEYAAGKSPRRVAFNLNHDNIPCPTGGAWSASTINGNAARGTGILNNEIYIGRLIWNRLRFVKNPDTGKRISRPNPPDEWVIHEVPDLRVVPQDLWDAVKTRQAKVKKSTRPDCQEPRPFWERTRPKYLLSGLMRCGACGGAYTKISANLFGCATARNKGTCGNRLNMRRDILEETILGGLKGRLMDPELFKEFEREFRQEIGRLNAERSIDKGNVGSDLDRVAVQIERLVMAIANGADAQALNTKIKDLERRQTDLRRMFEEATDPEPLLHPNLAVLYREKIAGLRDALYQPDARDEAFELIRSLIEKVVLTPVEGELSIDLHGEIAGILSICDDRKKPASSSKRRAEQIKVVAGARNHRELTLQVMI